MTAAAQLELISVPLANLKVHPRNPRQDVGDVDDLVGSIKEFGVLEPIVVVRQNGGFLNVMGSRRAAAAKKAGLTSIPARVMDLDDAKAAAAALIENLHRKDLNPLEEAQGYSDYLDLTGETQKALAEKVGRAPSTIANALRLLKAPKVIREALRTGFITAAHVRVLLQVKDDSLLSKVSLESQFRAATVKGPRAKTVDELANDVHRWNELWEQTGPPAVARAKAKLAEQQKNQKGFTITWRKDPDRYGDKIDIVKALGEPPAKIHGEFFGSPKKHDKLCTCRAFEIKPDWDGDIEVTRVCIDAKGMAALLKAGEGHRPYTPSRGDYGRPTTKAGKAAYVRRRVDSHLGVSGTAGWGRRKPAVDTFKKLVSGGWSADRVARLVAYALVVDRCTKVGAEQLELYHRIQKMSPSKARTLVLEHAAAIVNGEVLDGKDGGARLAARVEVMRGFGIPVGPKIAEQADKAIASLAPAKKAKR